MLFNHFDIRFKYPLEGFPSPLLLSAKVTWNSHQHCYSLENICLPGSPGAPVMQAVHLRKKRERWVHPDSESASLLSESAGTAIDEAETEKLEHLNNECPELGYYLEKAIETDRADFGNIQLFNPAHRSLSIVTQRGFQREFLAHFKIVTANDTSACGHALLTGQPVVVPDVTQLPSFTPHLEAAAKAGYRSVISTPVTAGSRFLGMLSTHSSQPHKQWNLPAQQQIATDLGLCLEARSSALQVLSTR